ncbi:MAG: carboxylesterase [Thiotrichales bacterium]|nr:carboxylesterase [Thiotrichales bacterium]
MPGLAGEKETIKDGWVFAGLKQTPPVVVEPPGPANKVVIWLHGLGADGYDFADIVPQLGLGAQHGIRFIFPHAPIMPVSLNGGMQMHAWYDIRSLDLLNEVDAAGIRVACYQVYELIEQLVRQGWASSNIVLAGFSQGGVIALHAALSGQFELAGVIALSTYCPMAEQFYLHRDLPILMMHGSADPVVSLAIGMASKASLEKGGYEIDWRTYPMAHQVCAQQLGEIGRWLLELDTEPK